MFFHGQYAVYRVFVVILFLVHGISGCGNTGKFQDKDECPQPNLQPNPNRCGKCGYPIQFTLLVENSVLNPKFKYNITLLDKPQTEMIRLLEKAAQEDKKFEFSASYHTQFGYFLTSIGGQESVTKGNYSYYWIMSHHPSGDSLQLGLSSHVPAHQDSVLFNLTRYGH